MDIHENIEIIDDDEAIDMLKELEQPPACCWYNNTMNCLFPYCLGPKTKQREVTNENGEKIIENYKVTIHPFRTRALEWTSRFIFKFSGMYLPNENGSFHRQRWNFFDNLNSKASGKYKSFNCISKDYDIPSTYIDNYRIPIRCYDQINHDNIDIEDNLYENNKIIKKMPLLLWIHGGGFCLGTRSMSQHDESARIFCKNGYYVISLTYRLAPEHQFPACIEDCYDILKWASINNLNNNIIPNYVDRDNILVGGDSAGGNLTAVLSTLCRDEIDARLNKEISLNPNFKKIKIRHQLLVYPALFFTPSPIDKKSVQKEFEDTPFISKPIRNWFFASYMGTDDKRRKELLNDCRIAPCING